MSTFQREFSQPVQTTRTSAAEVRIPAVSRGKPNDIPREPTAKLHPKEHGAYAILGIPIAAALLTTGATFAGIFVAIAAFTGFLAHEPLLVAWGHRGRRAQGSTPGAKGRLFTLLSFTLIAGCVAFLLGDRAVRWSLVACMVLASTSFAVAVAGRHRTLIGQLWGVAGLSLPCVPILLAGGLSIATALANWSVWLVGFCATTLAVRSVIAAQKRQSRTIHALLLALLSLLVAVCSLASAYWLLVSLPMLALSWFLLVAPPQAKNLRRVGWTLVAGTVLCALLVVSTF